MHPHVSPRMSAQPPGIWEEAKARVQQKKLVVSFTFPRALAPSSAAMGLKQVRLSGCFFGFDAAAGGSLPLVVVDAFGDVGYRTYE